ncbi:MAG: diguanylate cyclase response regulator, partial [Thalassolituus sp.]
MFLVIEDSPIVQKILRHTLRQQQVEPVVFASTKAEGVEAFEKHKDGLIAAIVDISLPDAPQGEMVNYIVENRLPCIV